MRRFLLFVSLMTVGLVTLGPSLAATAAPAGTVTLQASPHTVNYGRAVTFSGKIEPPSAGQSIEIVDGKGGVLAHATTRADGTYHASAKPQHSSKVHAEWGTISSAPAKINVRPVLRARRGEIKLFHDSLVQGHLAPAHGGSHITVTLWTNGKPVARATPMLTRKGNFATRIEVTDFGTHSFVVHFQDGDHAPVSWRSSSGKTAMPAPVRSGSSGPAVALLEKRLAELHYRVQDKAGTFDYHDADSVLAFHKVQGMARTTSVDGETWRRLAHPKIPVMRGPRKGTHWEVDLTKQVLYFVVDGHAAAIMHISSGKPSTPTRPGTFRVWTKQAGTNDHGMYYSSFFDGNRALHGYPDVPPYAASHGCVRIPFWNALWVYDRAPIGRLVLVYF